MAIAIKLTELEAFCLECPPDNEVTALLAGLGFHLVFEMPAQIYPEHANTPDLPAQYHYRDQHGTELIYLAGKDSNEQDKPHLPQHASRWWLYPGSSQYSYNLAMQTLSSKWKMKWE